MRVGIGFDFHPFEKGDYVVLGGVRVPSSVKLKGHSDADVIIHSVVDAVLGAAALGDIGDFFPPTEEKWKDVSSIVFLKRVLELIRSLRFRVVNVDITYVGEIPKLGKWKKIIGEELSNIIGAPVNVKATTMEGLGVIGRKEGAAAIAAVLLEEVPNGG